MMRITTIHGLWLPIAVTLFTVLTFTNSTSPQDSQIQSSPPDWCPSSSHFYCHKSDECKPAYVRCDGTKQCEEGEDEDDCTECTADTAPSLGMFYCNSTNKCISLDWKCDGTNDCGTGEDEGDDEANCGEDLKCNADTQFDCGNGQCIDLTWRCDVQVDCDNGADENQCESTCSTNQFTCNATGNTIPECISKQWVCDGENDCPNGDDEINCAPRVCPTGRFNCSAEKKCLPDSWKCDGDNDCSSGEDERDCPPSGSVSGQQCTPLEFKCKSSLPTPCIVGAWRCDGEPDCGDGSDEVDCGLPQSCSDSEFTCKDDGSCIPLFLTCSGKRECKDGSDEALPRCENNHTSSMCDLSKGQFSCGGAPNIHGIGKGPCVNLSKVCDKLSDCPQNFGQNRDENNNICGENPSFDQCQADSCGSDPRIQCQDIKFRAEGESFERIAGFVCQCPPGYNNINNVCYDKNECQDTEHPVCDHLCVNLEGSYKCSCNDGYSLESDGRSCKVSGGVHPKLLFSNRHEIRSLHIHDHHKEYMPLLDSTSAVALDFDYATREVFYSDMKERKLYKFSLPDLDNDEEKDDLHEQDLNIDGIQTPDGLAYDWVYKHLYWTDTATDTINMACVDDEEKDKPRKSVVLYSNENPNCTTSTVAPAGTEVCIDEPRALAVHPRKGWAFWSDWGSRPHIVLAALDGSKMEMIAYNSNQNNHQYLHWPNGLTLDLSTENERLYWIDAKLHSLFSCTINSCMNDISVLVYNHDKIRHPFSITVFENQLYWSDWATKHIVTANKYTGENITSILTDLEQPMDLKVFHPMSQQNSTNHCQAISSSSPLKCEQICVPKPWTRSSPTTNFSPVPLNQQKHSCLCSKGYRLKEDGRSCELIQADTTKSPLTDIPVSSGERKTGNVVDKNGAVTVGTIAAIGASVVLAVAVLVVLSVLFALRRLKKLKSKRMNFDNPIYKRTTEDKLELPRHEYQPSQTDPSAAVPLTYEGASTSNGEDLDV